jgi:hypothetical protein
MEGDMMSVVAMLKPYFPVISGALQFARSMALASETKAFHMRYLFLLLLPLSLSGCYYGYGGYAYPYYGGNRR